MKHAAVIERVRELAARADREVIAGAFVASLGGKPSRWRAPLMALAAAERVPAHAYVAFSASSAYCRECGLLPASDPDEPAELHERGQLLPGAFEEALLALEFAAAEKKSAPAPTKADTKRIADLLALVATLPDAAREGALNDAIRKAKLVVGNKYDVRHVIETLGACGILETPEHPGFTTAWTSFGARQDRPSVRVECDPPIAFWTAAHGVNAKNAKAWFGVSVPKGTTPRAVPVAKASEAAAKRDRRAARATELALGDVLAFTTGSSWRGAVVVGHHQDRGGRFPIVAPLAAKGRGTPTLAAVDTNKRVANAAMLDLWKRDDPKGRWRTLGNVAVEPVRSNYVVESTRRDGWLDRLYR